MIMMKTQRSNNYALAHARQSNRNSRFNTLDEPRKTTSSIIYKAAAEEGSSGAVVLDPRELYRARASNVLAVADILRLQSP